MYFIIQLLLLQVTFTSSPIPIASHVFQSTSQILATALIVQPSQTYSITFPNPFTISPKLTYSIKGYTGSDYLLYQKFTIIIKSMSNSMWEAKVDVEWHTNIAFLQIMYLTIENSFAGISIFNQFAIQYGIPGLSNITQKTSSVQNYQNIINYTTQSNNVPQNLTKTKIQVFLIGLSIESTSDTIFLKFPVNLNIETAIIGIDLYKINVKLSSYTLINLVYFNMVFYNTDTVMDSRHYIDSLRIDYGSTGGDYYLNQISINNFIMGLTDFGTDRGKATLAYKWYFRNIGGSLVATTSPSTPYSNGQAVLTRVSASILKIYQWYCPTIEPYYNSTTGQCSNSCPIYMYGDQSDQTCKKCPYFCSSCLSPIESVTLNLDICLSCSSNDHRILVNNQVCQCDEGYYDKYTISQCYLCQNLIPSCIKCVFNQTYSSTEGGLQFWCLKCQEGYMLINSICIQYPICQAGEGINHQNQCEICSLGCAQCKFIQQCLRCLTGYFLTLTGCTQCGGGCTDCTSEGNCLSCSSDQTLSTGICICPAGTYLQIDSCLPCSDYCLTCEGPTPSQCLTCDNSINRTLVNNQCVCLPNYIPSTNNNSCIILIVCPSGYILTSTGCKQICGDGRKIQYPCDDGNVISGDGCSSTCQIQPNYICIDLPSGPSSCFLPTITISNIIITKDLQSNRLFFEMDISPSSTKFNQNNLSNMLEFKQGVLIMEYIKYINGKLYISATYTTNINGKVVILQPTQNNSSSHNDNNSNSNGNELAFPKTQITIITNNSLQANYYSEEVYAQSKQSKIYIQIIFYLALFCAIGSLFVKGGIIVVTNLNSLQLAVMVLSMLTKISPTVKSLEQIRKVLGGFIGIFQPHTQLDWMKFYESFEDNFNVMLYIQLGLIVATTIVYVLNRQYPNISTLLSHFLQKSLILIVFNIPIAAFTILSMSNTVTNIILSSVTCAYSLTTLFHFSKYYELYWGINTTFELPYHKRSMYIFIWLSVACRICFCLTLSLAQEYSLCFGIIASIQCILILTMISIQPFKFTLNNILSVLAEVLNLTFCLITFLSTLPSIQTRYNCESIMLYIISAIVFISIGNMVYCLIEDLRQGSFNHKVVKDVNESAQIIIPNDQDQFKIQDNRKDRKNKRKTGQGKNQRLVQSR